MEKELETAKTVPQEETCSSDKKDTTPENTVSVPVKFNKEIKNLPIYEAAQYAQKGMKYDLISDDYKRLKELAQKQNKSVGEFLSFVEKTVNENRKNELISECGNEQIADRVLGLENKVNDNKFDSFNELNENFPDIKSAEQLPEEVVGAANEKGSRLLDEYLRYLLKEKRNKAKLLKQSESAKVSSVGSLNEADVKEYDLTRQEFLKGLWG